MNKFCWLHDRFTGYNKSRFVVIPIPYEKTTSYLKGTKKAPNEIIEASGNIELFDYETQKNTAEQGIHTTKPIISSNPEQLIEKAGKLCKKVMQDNKIPVILGGEHTVSIGPALAGHDIYEDLTVVQLDAHLDMKDSFEKSRFNHACVMRRIREKVKDTLHIGVRSCDDEEFNYAKQNKLNIFWDNKYNLKEIEKLTAKNIYVTIDMDVLNPAITSVGMPEPGGLSWYNTLEILKTLAKKNVVGFDVVELMPRKGFEYANITTAKLIYKLMGYI